MTYLRNACSVLFAGFFMMLLAACDGGGSSGGGGSSNGEGASDNATEVDLQQYAGTYTGTVNATVSLDNGLEPLLREIEIAISEDGKTITVEGESFPLESEQFQITVKLPLSNNNATCILDTEISGNLSEDQISGTLSGSGDCYVEPDGNQTGNVSGYFSASKT